MATRHLAAAAVVCGGERLRAKFARRTGKSGYLGRGLCRLTAIANELGVWGGILGILLRTKEAPYYYLHVV
jgi:hypothetical protein